MIHMYLQGNYLYNFLGHLAYNMYYENTSSPNQTLDGTANGSLAQVIAKDPYLYIRKISIP